MFVRAIVPAASNYGLVTIRGVVEGLLIKDMLRIGREFTDGVIIDPLG